MKDGCVVMLSEFEDKQLLAYNLFVKDIENNCVTHAYLVDEPNYCDSFNCFCFEFFS